MRNETRGKDGSGGSLGCPTSRREREGESPPLLRSSFSPNDIIPLFIEERKRERVCVLKRIWSLSSSLLESRFIPRLVRRPFLEPPLPLEKPSFLPSFSPKGFFSFQVIINPRFSPICSSESLLLLIITSVLILPFSKFHLKSHIRCGSGSEMR